MRVLGLCSYPVEAAATRFRMAQFVGPLWKYGIELDIHPFLNSGQFKDLYERNGIVRKAFGMVPPMFRRLGEIAELPKYDLIFVQREAMIFGPAVFEWIYQKLGNLPMILDLDDATYVRYISPSFGRAGSFFKFFGKTDNLIRRSAAVICGNRFIAEYVESKGTRTVVIPTVVDTDKFHPIEKKSEVPVLGWIGTHSTFPFLRSIFPVLEKLARVHQFKLRITGSGENDVRIDGVEIENSAWSLEREPSDFQSLDIGLYPIALSGSANEQWITGKSGFKAIQYMAVGVPFVMTPAGVCAEVGAAGKTHFNAESAEDWYNSLDRLLTDAALRETMGSSGRRFSLDHYTVGEQAALLADTMKGFKVDAQSF